MAVSDTIFILRSPGCIPQIKRCVEGEEMPFLKELLEVRPGELVSVLTWNNGEPYVEDGPQVLEMWNGKYRHLARRHRASTDTAFSQPRRLPPMRKRKS